MKEWLKGRYARGLTGGLDMRTSDRGSTHIPAAFSGVFGMYRQVSTEYSEDLLAIIREHQ